MYALSTPKEITPTAALRAAKRGRKADASRPVPMTRVAPSGWVQQKNTNMNPLRDLPTLVTCSEGYTFSATALYRGVSLFLGSIELELELIQTQMAQKPMLRAEVYAHAMRASQNRKKEVRREKEV